MRLPHKPLLYAAAALMLFGCSNNPAEQAKPETKGTATTEQAGAAPAQQVNIGKPLAADSLSGTVVETFDSGGYTYLQLDNGQQKVWVAIAPAKVTVGQQLSLINGPVMKDFYSRSIDRTFPEIVFSAGIKGEQKAASPHGAMTTSPGATNPHASSHGKPAAQQGAAGNDEASFMNALKSGQGAPQEIDPAMASGGSMKAIVSYQEIKVDKVEGGYSVGEIFSKAAELNGQKVKVRGKVVKVATGIMATNWFHIQDGSGDPMQNSHDLVFTSAELAEEGDIVVVEGVLAAKKDFGMGYFYEAIIEQATIAK